MADTRRRNGTILPRRLTDIGGYLSGAASVQCAPLRGRYESLSENSGDRRRMPGIGRVPDGRAASAARAVRRTRGSAAGRERIAEKQQLAAATCIDQFAPQRIAGRK